MSWYVGRSLDQLLAEINAAAPGRSKASDGSIGDTSHSSRDSDHNPCACHSAVCARDFTHDPPDFDSYAFAEWLRARCQKGLEWRVTYIISKGRIASGTSNAWNWRAYTGSNPHDHHVHVSVDHGSEVFDDGAGWLWSGSASGGDDEWMSGEPADVWATEWGQSGKSAMNFIDTLDELAAEKTWTRKPWSAKDPATAAIALQRVYEWCERMQADITEIKSKL